MYTTPFVFGSTRVIYETDLIFFLFKIYFTKYLYLEYYKIKSQAITFLSLYYVPIILIFKPSTQCGKSYRRYRLHSLCGVDA